MNSNFSRSMKFEYDEDEDEDEVFNPLRDEFTMSERASKSSRKFIRDGVETPLHILRVGDVVTVSGMKNNFRVTHEIFWDDSDRAYAVKVVSV